MAKRFKDLNPVRQQRLIKKAGGGRKAAAAAYNKSLPNKIQTIPQAGTVQKTQTPLSAKIGSGTVEKTPEPSVIKNQPQAIPQVGTVAKTSNASIAKDDLNRMKRQFFRSQGMIPGTAKHAKRFGLNAAPAAQGGATQPFEYDPGYQLSIDGGSFGDFKDTLASRYMVPGRGGGDPRAMTDRQRANIDKQDPLSGLQKLQYAIADFDPGQVSLAAQRAGITNVNSEKDFQELYNELTRSSTGMQTAAQTGDTGRQGPRDRNRIGYKKAINRAVADGTLTQAEIKGITDQFGYSKKNLMKVSGKLFDKNFPGRELTIRTPAMGKKNIAAAEEKAAIAEGGGGPKVEGTDFESLLQTFLAGIAANNQAQALNQRLGYVAPQFGLNPFNMQGIGAFRSGGNQFGTPSPFMGLSQIAS